MMTFDPGEALGVGRVVLELSTGDPLGEPYFRCCANRAYYAVYGRLRRELERLHKGLFPGRGRHTELVSALLGSADPHVKRIGTRLNNLKHARENADYVYDTIVSEEMARLSVDKAGRALDRIGKLDQPQVQAIAAMLVR